MCIHFCVSFQNKKFDLIMLVVEIVLLSHNTPYYFKIELNTMDLDDELLSMYYIRGLQ